MKKIGMFGGSFDPIHLGHLLLAEQCLEAGGLDQVYFVPAAIPPHKQDFALTKPEHRVEMVRLAIGGNDRFHIETCELDRDGVSFTVDTLAYLADRNKSAELFLLMGADSLDEFHTWKDPETICELATPMIVARPGAEKVNIQKLEKYADEPTLDRIRQYAFQSRMIEISSTEIRQRVEQGKSIRYLMPRAVEQFILEKELYREG